MAWETPIKQVTGMFIGNFEKIPQKEQKSHPNQYQTTTLNP